MEYIDTMLFNKIFCFSFNLPFLLMTSRVYPYFILLNMCASDPLDSTSPPF